MVNDYNSDDDYGNVIPGNGSRQFWWNLARAKIEFSALWVWIHSKLIKLACRAAGDGNPLQSVYAVAAGHVP